MLMMSGGLFSLLLISLLLSSSSRAITWKINSPLTMKTDSKSSLSLYSNARSPIKTSSINRSTAQKRSSSLGNITLACVSWNLHEKSPSLKHCKFLSAFRSKDIVSVGVQECENLKPRRFEGSRSVILKKRLKQSIGSLHSLVASHKMGGLQVFLFVKKNMLHEINGLQLLGVPCGVGNIFINKGAVCALLRVKDRTIVFVNAHLAAHEQSLASRNENYFRIRDSVINRAHLFFSSRQSSSVALKPQTPHRTYRNKYRHLNFEKVLAASGVPKDKLFLPYAEKYEDSKLSIGQALRPDLGFKNEYKEYDWPFDAVFFFGDLNYRVELSRSQMNKFLRRVQKLNKSYKSLVGRKGRMTEKMHPIANDSMMLSAKCFPLLDKVLKYDQLTAEIKQKNAFSGFNEGRIRFLPTYKFDEMSAVYDTSSKNRCPSWTDRVLYKVSARSAISAQFERYISCDVQHGDHRPVIATFSLSFD